MNTEFLKSLGITEQHIIDAIFAENGRDVNKAKGDYNELKSQLANAKSELDKVNKELETIKADTSDYADMKNKVSEFENEKSKINAEWETKLNDMYKKNAVEAVVRDAKGRNLKAVMALMDMDKITYEDGELKGAKEQIEALAASEETKFLFGSDVPKGNPPAQPDPNNGAGNPQSGSLNDAIMKYYSK